MRRYIIQLLSISAIVAIAQDQAFAQVFSQVAAKGVSHRTSTFASNPTATSASSKLTKLHVPGNQVRSLATKLSLRYKDVENIRISPDTRNSQLVVLAPEDAQLRIAADVRTMLGASGTMVQPTSATAAGPLTARLENITWREFEDNLRQVTDANTPTTTSRNGERASFHLNTAPLQNTTVDVDRRNNLVTVVAPMPAIAGWQTLIGAIDKKPSFAGETTAWMRIENAEPAPIQRALRLLRELRAFPSATQNAGGATAPFRNAVFQQNAAPQNDSGSPDANSEGETPEGGSGVIGDTQIQFVEDLGQIILRGTKRDVERIKELIKDIEEKAKLTQPEVEVVQLKHVDANAVSTLLQELYEEVLSARQGEVSITSLDAPNALLLIGRKEAIDGLKELIDKIDQPVEGESGLRVFRLRYTSAIDAETAIRDFFTDRPGSSDDLRPGLGIRVRVLADYRTNSLVVSAAPRDMAEVTRLINELDVEQVSTQAEIKIFTLNNAIAEDLATVLQAAINGESEDGGDENATKPSSALQIVKLDSDGGEVLNSGILSNATVTADAGANALVVRAQAASMPLIAELIRQLDKSPDVDSLVKVFTIENGDAAQLSQALVDLFGDDAATNGTNVGAGNLAGLPPSTAGAESSLVPLRFSTDVRTNSIIASGAAEDLEVVESILLRLDSEGFAERITEVVWLRHNDAQLISDAVTNYVNSRQQSQTTITQYQQGLGPYDLLDRDIIAIPEINSNSILLSVSPRLYEEVRRLIDQLDRRRPMVLIKVLIAEVSLDDTFEIGGEVGLQDSLQFDRSVLDSTSTTTFDPGFNFNNAGVPNNSAVLPGTLATTGLSSFGVGTTNNALGYGGFVLNAASDSISLLMRTLQEANRLQVLSRPQIMTLDNTEAEVRVGRQIARVTDIVNNGVAGTQVVTEDISVGLILQVRPRVGADGLIIMDVSATRSDRDNSNGTLVPTGDGGTVFINDILDTTAQSVVTAFSGQTVVFGGLIQKSRSNFSRKVPFLGDIPLLGYMFKYDQETETRSELLVVLTPMVVGGDEDLEYVKQVESSRMSWCLADVVEAHGDVGLSGGYGLWGPAAGNTIYPDLQPTADRIINQEVISDTPIGEQIIGSGSFPTTVVEEPVVIDAAVGNLPAGMSPSYETAVQGYTDSGTAIRESQNIQGIGTVPNGPSSATVQQFSPGNAIEKLPTPNVQGTQARPAPSPFGGAIGKPMDQIPSPSDGAAKSQSRSVGQIGFALPEGSMGMIPVQADWRQEIERQGDEKKPVVRQASPKTSVPTRLGVSQSSGRETTESTMLGSSGVSDEKTASSVSAEPTISPRAWIR